MPSTVASSVSSPLRNLITNKLVTLAKVGFTQNRGELAASGTLISDQGGGLIGNNSAGILSNNAGNIIANNGAGYRLFQAASGAPVIPIEAEAGETLLARRLWPDNRITLYFKRKVEGIVDVSRTVYIRGGKPIYEEREEELERWPNGIEKRVRRVTTEIFGDGRFYSRIATLGEGLADGATTKLAIEPGSYVRDDVSGAAIAIEELALDRVALTGSFRFAYEALGLVEKGSFVDMKPGGDVAVSYWDPLALQDGDSTTADRAGKLMYTKRQRTVAGKRVREFDMQDGLTMKLDQLSADQWTGKLSLAGQEVADVKLDAHPDGSSLFTVTLFEDRAVPLIIGYGLTGSQPGTRPTSPPQYVVSTLGGSTAGYVDGPLKEARLSSPLQLVRSRLNPNRFFIADDANQRVRTLDLGSPALVGTYAGDGVAGFVNGTAASARFHGPAGLAVGPDDTLYVADSDGHRIRVIAPNGEVTTLAGDGVAGLADGPGETARFNNPVGLALDAAGKLYVADVLNHAIRRVETSGPDKGEVTTIAGNGTSGMVDGPRAGARFKLPISLLFGPDGALYIADRDNRRIRKLVGDTVTTVAGGGPTSSQWMDGPALETTFNPPRFMAFGPDGLLYFSTAGDIFYLTADGQVHSYAGVAAPGANNGVNWRSAFSNANGMAFRNNGVLLILDDNLLRAITPPSAAGN